MSQMLSLKREKLISEEHVGLKLTVEGHRCVAKPQMPTELSKNILPCQLFNIT